MGISAVHRPAEPAPTSAQQDGSRGVPHLRPISQWEADKLAENGRFENHCSKRNSFISIPSSSSIVPTANLHSCHFIFIQCSTNAISENYHSESSSTLKIVLQGDRHHTLENNLRDDDDNGIMVPVEGGSQPDIHLARYNSQLQEKVSAVAIRVENAAQSQRKTAKSCSSRQKKKSPFRVCLSRGIPMRYQMDDERELNKLIGEGWQDQMKAELDAEQTRRIKATKDSAGNSDVANPHYDDIHGPLGLGVTPLIPESYSIVGNTTLLRCQQYYQEIMEYIKDQDTAAAAATGGGGGGGGDNSEQPQVPVIRLLDETLANLHTTLDSLITLNALTSDEEIKEIIPPTINILANFETELRLDPDLAKAIANDLKGKGPLHTEEEKILAQRWVKEWKESSASMPLAKQAQTRELLSILFSAMSEYTENIYNNNRTLTVTSDVAMFLPQQQQDVLKYYLGLYDETPIPRGQNLTLPANIFFAGPFLRHIPYGKLREEMYYKYESIPENLNVLETILDARYKLANLYGKETYAHLTTETSIFEDPQHVVTFLENASKKVLPKSHAQTKILENLKRQTEGVDTAINDWDIEYYVSKASGSMANLEYDKVKEYFPIDVVVDGMRFVAERLFGVSFIDDTAKAFEKGDLWDASIVRLNVRDSNDDAALGYIYLDLFDRSYKQKEALTLRARAGYSRRHSTTGKRERRGARTVLSTSIAANDDPEKPTLLTHEEVRTLFHEFGHCLHEILSDTESYGTSGCQGLGAQTDFVEIAAVMMERFAWDPRVLGTFATHYKTREPPPDKMLLNLANTRKAFAAVRAQEKIAFALLDQEYHSDWSAHAQVEEDKGKKEESDDPAPSRTSSLMSRIFSQHFPVKSARNPFGGSWETKWSHLAEAAYAGSYFTYIVAEVVCANIWEKLFEIDPLNIEAGKTYQEHVLAPGNKKDPKGVLRDLLGDDYLNLDAWLRSMGAL
eukprot:jgi/Bigna1/68741/fgenesh1_pg.7_\